MGLGGGLLVLELGWVAGSGDGGVGGRLGVEFVAGSQIWQTTEMDPTKVVWASGESPAVG